ncbi:MAG: glycerophosphodiester phosphodiesterase, partial [Anaerolineae bacterium]
MLSFPAARGSHSRPLIFGHRGASRSAPENTLAAFRRAAEMGADGVELDVHLTADGVPVVIHDARVNATTDGSGYIGEMTLAEVKELDAG